VTPVEAVPRPDLEALRPGTWRGTGGFFRVARDHADRWWLLDPSDRKFFARGVQGVTVVPRDPTVPPAFDPAARLRQWGFNLLGPGGDGALQEDGFASLAVVDFVRGLPAITGPGVRLPDVFASDWPRLAGERAQSVCAPLAGVRELLGWVSDDAPGWGQSPGPRRPSLLQVCLSLEPGFATYHAAWEFVLALHGGRIESVGRAWGVPLANKEVLREMTRAEQGIFTRGHLRDEARWSREFARRYFTTTSAAIRAADPHHLVFGCRFAGPIGTAVAAEAVFPSVDVALLDWNELPAAGAAPGPILATNVNWAEESFWRRAAEPPARNAAEPAVAVRHTRVLTSVERMLRGGRAALERAARHPAAVGYLWSQWQDDPAEQPPFARGLVHANGVEAREHTELLAQFNHHAETLHRASVRPPSS
jgi:hypothetical protein